jgi:hypothetical protein
VGYKLGRWLDVGWWQRDLRPAITPPSEPCPFSTIRTSPPVRQALFDGERILSNAAGLKPFASND